MIWRDFEAAAPEIARLGKERLDRARVALLGTLRKDGSPRISPVEPFLTRGHLIFGAMSWSLKTRDLQRDPRCVLHSAISTPDSGEGELKLYGRATEVDDRRIRDGSPGVWWAERPSEAAVVFSLFTPVMLVQLLLDSTPVPHIYGVQPHHLMICDALGLDRAWYAVPSHQENSA